jgi:hypothetical protein
MKKTRKSQVIKMNLTLTQEFYELLKENARNDYMKVATWTKRFLMKSLLDRHNAENKSLTQNGTTMEN